MENIAKNPGLLDIAEKIFLQLNYEDLMAFIFSQKSEMADERIMRLPYVIVV